MIIGGKRDKILGAGKHGQTGRAGRRKTRALVKQVEPGGAGGKVAKQIGRVQPDLGACCVF